MTANLPATQGEGGLVESVAAEATPDQRPAARQAPQQNLRDALLPMAIVAFLIVSFIAAAWTFLAALPPPA